jgi:hypothetical protein
MNKMQFLVHINAFILKGVHSAIPKKERNINKIKWYICMYFIPVV